MRAIFLCTFFAFLATTNLRAADIDDAAFPNWMEGHWCQGEGDRRGDEFWLAEAGGVMVGLSRTVKPGSRSQFEFMRIERSDGVITFIAQPQGNPPTPFKRTQSGENWMRFENAAHDFPNVVIYRREGAALHAEISGPGTNDETLTIPFEFQRCAD